MERNIMVDTLKARPLELKNYPEYQDDTELVQVAVRKNAMALQYASARLRDDVETVMIAVKKSGLSLQFASESCKSDKAIILQAVTSDGNALQFVPEGLQSNREIVLKASRTCKAEQIPSEFLADEEIARNLMKNDCTAFAVLADELRNNMDFVVKAVGEDTDMLMYVPDSFFENKENILALVSKNAAALQEAPKHFKNDKEIGIVAMQAVGSPWAYSLLSNELQQDAEIIRTLVENITFNYDDVFTFINVFSSKNIPDELLQDDDFVERITNIYEHSDDSITLDKRLVLRMIELQIFNEDMFDDEILADPDVQAAIEQHTTEDD